MYYMTLDPVAWSWGAWSIRWYALAYVFTILCAYAQGRYYLEYLGIKDMQTWRSTVDTIVLAGLIGGRLGHGFFYDWLWWSEHPWEVFYIWHGGMSFFGGIMGASLGLCYLAYRDHLKMTRLSDVVVSLLPPGLALGRVANFVNSECVGKVHHAWSSVVFPLLDDLPRYPTQLWEAFAEGLGLACLLFCLPLRVEGLRTGMFLLVYGAIRLAIEPFKEPEALGSVYAYTYNPSSVLALLSVLLGCVYLYKLAFRLRHGCMRLR